MNNLEQNVVEKDSCIVCTKEKKEGIYIWDHFICRECEEEMVTTDVHEDKYPFFIKQMRKLWMLKENA